MLETADAYRQGMVNTLRNDLKDKMMQQKHQKVKTILMHEVAIY